MLIQDGIIKLMKKSQRFIEKERISFLNKLIFKRILGFSDVQFKYAQ